jgi:hypothetical protein
VGPRTVLDLLVQLLTSVINVFILLPRGTHILSLSLSADHTPTGTWRLGPDAVALSLEPGQSLDRNLVTIFRYNGMHQFCGVTAVQSDIISITSPV